MKTLNLAAVVTLLAAISWPTAAEPTAVSSHSAVAPRTVAYDIRVLEKRDDGAVAVVLQSQVLTLDGSEVPVVATTMTTFPVGCTDLTGPRPVPCGDQWKDTRQLAVHLTPAVHDGFVETRLVINGGAGKGHYEPEPQLSLAETTLRMRAGEQRSVPVALPLPAKAPETPEYINYLVEIKARPL